MEGVFGAILVALAAGGVAAALAQPIQSIFTIVIQYLRDTYGKPTSTRKNSP